MKVLIQRVKAARVEINQRVVGHIETGLLALVGFEPHDESGHLQRMLERVVQYRVFPDADDKMNLSLLDIGGGLLLVPQFTLAADTRRGRRPSFTSAAPPVRGEALFAELWQAAQQLRIPVGCGEFGADMQVHLQNDGPVTFLLEQ
jgi:D-tyrosyl-tRNA(Tyr) deacylase